MNQLFTGLLLVLEVKKRAHDLAKTVTEVKDGDLQQAVDADEKLSITWGAIKDIR